ncbi:hypothetical protein F5Y04DRAFT_247442 [Hypomontagnella monticulosa]|nr:hypothetical protein F5Y04DRAFT_247442 [Hypomontagnella monticulosa]
MRGQVQIQGVEASYDGTNRVFKGLTLDSKAGEKVAICRRTRRYITLLPPFPPFPFPT